MASTRTLIEETFKESNIRVGPVVAGETFTPTSRFSRDQLNHFIAMLEKSRDQNGMLAYGVFALHVIVLLAAIVFAWSRRDDSGTLTAVLSVGSGILFATILSFRSFWREKTTMDLLLAILPGATPDEALKILLATLEKQSK